MATIYYPTTTKANPALANTTSWWSGGTGNYNALMVDLRHDLAHGLQFRANYTWSKNLDDGSAWNTSVSANTPAFVEVPQLPHLDYGPAATDMRHAGGDQRRRMICRSGAGKAVLRQCGRAVDRLVSRVDAGDDCERCRRAFRSRRSLGITRRARAIRATRCGRT